MSNNDMSIRFKAKSENESFARVCVSAFLASYDPTVDELGDIKTAVSEAVTNCVVHAYPDKNDGYIDLYVSVSDNNVYIRITDNGVGIEDISKVRQPFFTSKPSHERSGMGFTIMEGFMDKLQISSKLGNGTSVEMYKYLGDCKKVVCGVWYVW